jgi:hypothetical protein
MSLDVWICWVLQSRLNVDDIAKLGVAETQSIIYLSAFHIFCRIRWLNPLQEVLMSSEGKNRDFILLHFQHRVLIFI